MTRPIQNLSAPGVRVLGHVPDVEPLFRGCRLSVAPLRYGAGVKGKVTQSLALGLPAVATSIAAEGLDLVPGTHLSVADTADEFADKVVELYTDDRLWSRMSAAGRDHIKTRLGYAGVKASVRGIFEAVERQLQP
jgi:glycosyltransferase involved in cell wall biosynthesis